MRKTIVTLSCLLLAILWSFPADAQYFGRNKPRYEDFDFKVIQTPTFEIYHYLDNPELEEFLANQAEHWYQLHQAALGDTFTQKNPLIFYNDHPDFQQTNAIGGSIGVGTGGVTEGFKNRVIMPLAMSNAQTKHVLGHELVHAFQYHMIINGDSTSLRNLGNIPLWMVEGLAEYMSIGRVDANTSLWMRDAVLNDNVPELKELNNPQYFPYRWGQAFWAFVAGLKGDQIIEPLFVSTAKHGLKVAIQREVGMSMDDLSKLWVGTIKKHYGEFMKGRKEDPVGKPLVTAQKEGGRLNIAPVLSPNGKYVAFLSEKGLFGIDLYVANAVTGEVIKKVHSSTKGGHLDDLSFIENAGAWSPKSDKLAIVGVSKGSNVLVIKDLNGKLVESFPIPEVPAFGNPAWAPDGKSIVVAGLKNGQVDLFQVFLKNKKVVQLTDDRYSEMHPSWKVDGSQLVFSTDQKSMENGDARWTFGLATLDMVSGRKTLLNLFDGADNLNPIFDRNENILFLSDRDGFRNLYQYEPATGKLFQQTDLLTGISGITMYAPAISASVKGKRDRVLYTHYYGGKYGIYRAKAEDFLHKEVNPDSIDLAAATLPRVNSQAPDIVEANLPKLDELPGLQASQMRPIEYKPKFKLDYIGGGAGVGIVNNPNFGGARSGLAGGADMIFSDILGDHQLYTGVFLNGELLDAGASIAYLNRKKRFNWGIGLSHLPFSNGRFGFVGNEQLPIENPPDALFGHYILDRIRTFEEKLSVFAQLPFSKNLRLEGGLSAAYYSNRIDRFDQYFDQFGNIVYEEREKISEEEAGLNLFSGNLASANIGIVGDNSYFGITSPVKGHRFRISAERNFGDFNFTNVTIDLRKYMHLKPVTFAVRGMHIGRYGEDANSFNKQFVGFPWFVRGYEFNSANTILQQNNRSINELIGSKMLVGNFEVRMPFTGPEGLSVIKSKFLLSELSFFVDGGMAWDTFGEETANDRAFDFNPLFSAGASVRINVFGALILEPYYAFPLLQETKGTFGLNIVPGW